jgi:hypothetical protein
VTLWWPPKSSEFGAILWLLSRPCDHEQTSRTGGHNGAIAKAGKIVGSLASHSFAAGFRRFSRHEIPKQLDWIGAKGAGNGNKFDDINAALAAFVLGNKRLRPAEFPGQGLLTNACGMSHCDKDGNEPGIFRRFEGLLHAPPSLRIGGVQFDPGIGLSQNWILCAL